MKSEAERLSTRLFLLEDRAVKLNDMIVDFGAPDPVECARYLRSKDLVSELSVGGRLWAGGFQLGALFQLGSAHRIGRRLKYELGHGSSERKELEALLEDIESIGEAVASKNQITGKAWQEIWQIIQ